MPTFNDIEKKKKKKTTPVFDRVENIKKPFENIVGK